jgi:hypothetical protein
MLFVCFGCHVEISQTLVPPFAHYISLESSQWVSKGVHWGGFILFRPMVWELLRVIEHWKIIIIQWKFRKIKLKLKKRNWGCTLGSVGKVFFIFLF